MKKLMFVLFLMILSFPLIAQVVEPPNGWVDIITNPGKWFADFGAVALLTAFLATFVNGLLKITKNFAKQLIAWVVAVILVVGSDLLNFGFAKDFPVLFAVINGFGAGLASNGVFDIPFVKSVLDAIAKWFPPKK